MFFNLNSNFKASQTVCRFIVRDFCGKNCWDCCLLHPPDENRPPSYFIDLPVKKLGESPLKDANKSSTTSDTEMEQDESSGTTFEFAKLPFVEFNDIPKDIDILDNVRALNSFELFLFRPDCLTSSPLFQILQYISYSSPECKLDPNRPLNILWDLNSQVVNALNVDDIKQRLTNQESNEQNNFRAQ